MQTYTVVNENIIKDLVAIVGNKYVLTEKDRLVLYGQDEGAERKAYRLPEAVVLPATTEEVAAVIQLAVKYHIAVIPRGAGTGLEGGAVANQYGGIILSTERMNAVLEINDEWPVCTCRSRGYYSGFAENGRCKGTSLCRGPL